ncbi:type II toxin-antitoxin system RelE/ParE family toxin, partial [Escherichia coli]|uniref:type II toxin-antitoxin system RelE/ParE family toxin n=1 Tax=Escherichia coli TaxID=562 RepID=UPI0030765E5E
MKLTVSPLAEHDLEAIGDWIAQDNPVRAISFTEELYQQCLLIAESPVLYRERPELGAGIRGCSYGRYLLLFRVLGFAPIFPDTCYHLTHYWPAAADIPV